MFKLLLKSLVSKFTQRMIPLLEKFLNLNKNNNNKNNNKQQQFKKMIKNMKRIWMNKIRLKNQIQHPKKLICILLLHYQVLQ